MISALIFDLDGTLLDTTEGIVESVEYTIEELGLMQLDRAELLSFIGPPIIESFIKKFKISTEDAKRATCIFRTYYMSQALFKAKPYKGIFELLKELRLRGIKTGVATYKREDYALKLLYEFGFNVLMDSMHGADDNNYLQKADIIKMVVDDLGIIPSKAVYVGDTELDFRGATVAGTAFIGVTYGFGYKKGCCNLEKFANSPKDILGYIIS